MADQSLTCARLRLRRFRRRHGHLRNAGRRPHGHGARPSPTTSSSTTTRSCWPPATSRPPEDAGRRCTHSAQTPDRRLQAGPWPCRARPEERQCAGAVVELPARHSRSATMIDAKRQLHHRHAGGGLGRRDLQEVQLRDVSPPGSIGFNWNECQTTFMQGRAAMWVDGIGFARAAWRTAPAPASPARSGTRSCRAARAQGHHCAHLRRRLRHPGGLARRRDRPGSSSSGRLSKPMQLRDARRRRAACRPRLSPYPQRGGDRPQPLPARVLPYTGKPARRSPAPACRRSCR